MEHNLTRGQSAVSRGCLGGLLLLGLCCSGCQQAAETEYEAGLNHMGRDNFPAALRAFGVVLMMDEKNAIARVLSGDCNAGLKAFDSAIEDYTKALQVDPTLGDAYLHRAIAHTLRGDNGKAAQDCETAVKTWPSETFRHFCQAMKDEAAGRHREALQEYEKSQLSGGISLSAPPSREHLGLFLSSETRKRLATLRARIGGR